MSSFSRSCGWAQTFYDRSFPPIDAVKLELAMTGPSFRWRDRAKIHHEVTTIDWYRYSCYDGKIKTCYNIDTIAMTIESRGSMVEAAMVDRY